MYGLYAIGPDHDWETEHESLAWEDFFETDKRPMCQGTFMQDKFFAQLFDSERLPSIVY